MKFALALAAVLAIGSSAFGQQTTQQQAAQPRQSTSKGPSLQETLDWMTLFIAFHGMIQGNAKEEYRYVAWTKMKSLGNCSVQFEAGGSFLAEKITVPLVDIDPTRIQTENIAYAPLNAKAKSLYGVRLCTANQKFTIRMDGEFKNVETGKIDKTLMAHCALIRFADEDDAERFARASQHAVELCGGKPSIF